MTAETTALDLFMADTAFPAWVEPAYEAVLAELVAARATAERLIEAFEEFTRTYGSSAAQHKAEAAIAQARAGVPVAHDPPEQPQALDALVSVVVELARWANVATRNGDLHARLASALTLVGAEGETDSSAAGVDGDESPTGPQVHHEPVGERQGRQSVSPTVSSADNTAEETTT